ncbi:hypothetical protein B0A52_00309 [Exophiala mesophila]|uniref:UBR-type domain-containing protein n=1 Tax=Exophiala mesophila TaxID=212818 RepID=A0A438NJR7_EXOME|nr:hypothetical protein B0A52_00309 [Exophiala mesophila]
MASLQAPDTDDHKPPSLPQATAQDSQTASEFINEQLALEADAKEVLPYKFDKCTYDLGPLRQSVFACLTCNPPPASPAQRYRPAGVCYSCSISCHGEHTLVELFNRRNFVCDCGTSRIQSSQSCMLRLNPATGRRGVSDQEPAADNHYNHNYQNRFCACAEEYDAHTEKGTMYQCIGLGTVETGGCGEDWYHPECLMGLDRDWFKKIETSVKDKQPPGDADTEVKDEPSHPVPPGFPAEDDFDLLICYKCVEANPWIKKYANTPGFLAPVFHKSPQATINTNTLKRKASDSDLGSRPGSGTASPSKRVKEVPESSGNPTSTSVTADTPISTSPAENQPKHALLPTAPISSEPFTIFTKEDFRDHLCHCPQCYPELIPHQQLIEEEEIYEPSISDSEASQAGDRNSGTRSHGTASLLDRGEAALSGMDRVKAIEGVMVYNHLRDKVKEFLKPYAESGQAVSADDIKAYFEKLRGDEGGIKEASAKPEPADGSAGGKGGRNGSGGGSGSGDGDGAGGRREQSGY